MQNINPIDWGLTESLLCQGNNNEHNINANGRALWETGFTGQGNIHHFLLIPILVKEMSLCAHLKAAPHYPYQL